MRRLIFFLLTFLCVAPMNATAAETPHVVVSIKPLHSLVSAVMDGVGTPELLVKKGSPHGYSLRPSEAQALAHADLVIWVGHELESFLVKPLKTVAHRAEKLTLAHHLKDDLLTKRQGHQWETHMHHHDEAHHDEAHHDEAHHDADHHDETASPDLHIWLNPHLAKKIVAETAATLVRVDPQHTKIYRENEAKVISRLDQLDKRLREKLKPFKNTPYLVFHAAYQYFEAAYGLNPVGSVTIDPERKPGAKRISEIRHKLKETNARCVFSEPQFESRIVATIIEGTGVKTGTLDPVGADIPPGQDAYFTLLSRLADDLAKGLQ